MSSATPAQSSHDLSQLAPGVTIQCRDEQWLVSNVARTTDGFRVRARGVSDYVRDTTATFFTALDDIMVFDPANVTVRADNSPHFRHTRLWLESTLRRTPVPLHQEEPEVSAHMLADPLEYQLSAVKKALSAERIRPRVLLADAVGLGKTLEIGMIVSELIRRGRGERILVVTPKHVMEQFQQELWTRFAVPLVRLDSQGIQKVRQKLPASKNPFTYFPRVIVSMDTLKSPKYRAQLNKVRWDVVVIDEIHNATNAGSQNNELARTLAPTTEALILASATPHNGREDSFKEILRLLDPLSVLPDGSIDKEAAKKLIIRRHRNSPEVASIVGEKWAKRLEPRNIAVPASSEENAVARVIAEDWVHGTAGDRLFPWTLVKAYLSSPRALTESVEARMRLGKPEERTKLQRLLDINDKVTADTSAKFAELINYLTSIGVKKGSDRRVVIFSERVATLKWLQKNVSKALKMPKDAVKIMHGGLSDEEQLGLIDEFKRTDTALRVLITGDVASEGVNLHAQCHHLVHYDIPWSLIRIQQRNGRVDRYGQEHSPEITALLLDPQDASSIGEIHVLTRLIEREYAANQLLGDASPLMGKHNPTAEEDAIRSVLMESKRFDDVVANPEELITEDEDTDELDSIWALLASDSELDLGDNELGTGAGSMENESAHDGPVSLSYGPGVRHSLYAAENDYLEDALNEAYHDEAHAKPSAGGVDYIEHDNSIVELTPPKDLRRRFDYLPQDYVSYRKVTERLMLATSKQRGNEQLKAAREGDSEKSWPRAHFLGPLHPVTEWAADRALSAMEQSEIPAVYGDVEEPTLLLMGTLTNSRGQILSRMFVVATEGPMGFDVPTGLQAANVEIQEDVYAWLRDIGLVTNAINPGGLIVPDNADKLIAAAVSTAQQHLQWVMKANEKTVTRRIDDWKRREDAWWSANSGQLTLRATNTTQLIEREEELLKSMAPERTLVRPLVLVLPAPSTTSSNSVKAL
ncbi:DEAD/DEAH box helicase [Corynebacterium sp. 320]|uniref:DEAD/DEAH box helicase n=1 Tax=Corynebacterium TaxID=1716 RepID=UPI00125CC1CE|nr:MULTISPECIES: helicase-related protein [Corynebacterium]KAB1503863.1 DEAD/DEAH box helicase [Corynebacterium sp. 320]KAB3527999.1 DEAD/DEAH box helicase [Corynebacterium sp. 250]QNP91540.1 DEAD/DEAH box helicase family protein [Corynebacterium zhongnanshanii]